LLVYLPPGYDDQPARRYPVLYLNDGQNLFDGATSYVQGQDWGVDETAEKLIRAGEIEPLIIVAIYNTGEQRIDEYTPTVDPRVKKGGGADLYGRLLVEEVKPLVDESYRTHIGPAQTGLGGSSLGGLVSLHLALKYPSVFGKLMAMSPSVWWDRGMILRRVQGLKVKPSTRIWLDIGTKEGKLTTRNVRTLRDSLASKGWRLGDDLSYLEAKDAHHNEVAWGQRVDKALRFLYAR
jgi:predicted alpha/beta superfamily hydrolase